MVELSEDSIKQIKDNLDSVADTINEAIDDVQNNPDNKQEEKEQKQDDNVLNKDKSALSTQEKKRFTQIGQIFIDQWMKSIEKLRAAQEKHLALTTSKKDKEPSWLKKLLNRNKKEITNKPEKEKKSWIQRLMQVIGVLGLVYLLFKDKIDEWLPKVWDFIKDTGLKWLGIGLLVTKGIIPLVRLGLSKLGSWLVGLGGRLLGLVGRNLSRGLGYVGRGMKSCLGVVRGFVSKGINNIIGFAAKGMNFVKKGLMSIARSGSSKLLGMLGRGSVLGITAGVIALAVEFFPQIWSWLKETVSGMWEWIKSALPFKEIIEYVKSAWDVFINILSGIWDGLKAGFQFLTNALFDIPKSIMKWIGGGIMNSIGAIISGIGSLLPSWLFGGSSDEQNKDDEPVTSKTSGTSKRVSDTKEIKMKDDVLETIKEICERLNVFFSENSGGFIDLTKKVIKDFNDGFQNIIKQIPNIKIANVYNVLPIVTYKDSYTWDNSNRSKRSVHNENKIYEKISNIIQNGIVTNNVTNKTDDNRRTINTNQSWYDYSDYNVTYNTIDIPALDRAIKRLEETSKEEVKLLQSQNDYLVKMVNNMDGLGNKLDFLKANKPKQQPSNNIIPLSYSGQTNESVRYDAAVVKTAQGTMYRAMSA